MNFRAAGNLCAVNLSELGLPVTQERALEILEGMGYRQTKVTIQEVIKSMRRVMPTATYHRGAFMSDAPNIVDCSSLIKWAYSQRGIWIPRYSLSQREYFYIDVIPDQLRAGDLIFTTGHRSYFRANAPDTGVGHVVMATGDETVIHASSKEVNMIECPIDEFFERNRQKFRGIKRLIADDSQLVTLYSTTVEPLEESKDVFFKVIQRC